MRIRKNKKARVIALFSILTFLLSVGYAFLQTNLNANGTAIIKNKSWNLYYSNIQVTTGSVAPATAPTVSGTSTSELTWSANLAAPGDFFEFTVDVTNAGTVDAMIADAINTTLTEEQAKYLTYTVTYEDYKPIEQYDKLAVNETDSLRIRLEVKTNADPQDIPSQPDSFTLRLIDIYEIADSNAQARTKAQKYTVTFDKNHADATGTMANQLIIVGRATNLTLNSYERAGYHFTNWTTLANGTGTSYLDGQSVTDLGDITLYAKWAINTYEIAFDANGGTGTMANKQMTYGTASNLTANSFTRSGYTFKNWNTEADGSGTTYTNSQSVNNLTTENGATVTLYAQWEEQVTKYAVQIYGINQDVDANDQTLGLTFGPATGDNYNNAYVTHRYEETEAGSGIYNVIIEKYTVALDGTPTLASSTTLTDSNSNNVTRTQAQVTARENISLHDMTWTEIAAVSDKTVFEDCMLCGDTKSVKLALNDTIGTGSVYNQYGDGAGMLCITINTNYRKWNNTGNNDRDDLAYAGSRIRATLIGSIANVTKTAYAGSDTLDDTICLYSCIESDLQAVITPKKIKYVTGTNYTAGNYSLNDDIADSIWLFSEKEMRSPATWSGGTTEGVGTSGVAYDKFVNTESKYYSVESNNNTTTNNNRKAWSEAGSTDYWWLRSPLLSSTDNARYVGGSGNISNNYAYVSYGLAFGFCIK